MNQAIHKDFEEIFKYQDKSLDYPICYINEFHEFLQKYEILENQHNNFPINVINSLLSKHHRIHLLEQQTNHLLFDLRILLSLLKENIRYIHLKFNYIDKLPPALILGLEQGEFIILPFEYIDDFNLADKLKHIDPILNYFIYPILDTSDSKGRNLIDITTFHTSQVIKPKSLEELKNAMGIGNKIIPFKNQEDEDEDRDGDKKILKQLEDKWNTG